MRKMIDMKFTIDELKEIILLMKLVNDKMHKSQNYNEYIPCSELSICNEHLMTYMYSNISIKKFYEDEKRIFNILTLIRSSDKNLSEHNIRTYECIGKTGSSNFSIFPSSPRTNLTAFVHSGDDGYYFDIQNKFDNKEDLEALLFQMSLSSTEEYNNLLQISLMYKLYKVLDYVEVSIHTDLFELNSNDLQKIKQELIKLC